MNLNFEKKSLLTGFLLGFVFSALVFAVALLAGQLKKENNENKSLQFQMQKLEEIPLKIIDKTAPVAEKTYIYEEIDPKQIDKVIESENSPLYVKHAHKVAMQQDKAKIAIIIDDVGVSVANSQAVIDELPKEVTLAFLPYGSGTKKQIKQAYKKGHDSMLHLPTEPISTIDPGPNALYTSMNAEEITKTTTYNIEQLLDYIVGVNNHMGSKFTADQEDMEAVLKVVNGYNLFFLDSVTSAKTKVKAARNAVAKDMPLLKRNLFLDHEQSPEFIKSQLIKAEKLAKSKGFAIAIGHPHKVTTKVLKQWIKTLEQKNIQLVPITSILELTK